MYCFLQINRSLEKGSSLFPFTPKKRSSVIIEFVIVRGDPYNIDSSLFPDKERGIAEKARLAFTRLGLGYDIDSIES